MKHTMTNQVRKTILRVLCAGKRLDQAAEQAGVPVSVVREWFRRGTQDPEGPYGEFNQEIRQALRTANQRRIRACSRAIATARYAFGQPEDELVNVIYLAIMRMLEEGRIMGRKKTYYKTSTDDHAFTYELARRALELALSEVDDRIAEERCSWEDELDD